MTAAELLSDLRKAIRDEVFFLTREPGQRDRGLRLLDELDKALKATESPQVERNGNGAIEPRILAYLERVGQRGATVGQLDKALTMTKADRKVLLGMVRDGRVNKEGEKRGTRYLIAGGDQP